MFRSSEITRKKCGQIYILSDDNFTLICEFCEDEFYTLEDFRVHLTEHIPKSSIIIKTEDSISCDSAEPPEKSANVKDNFIDILQDFVGQSTATKSTESERSESIKSETSYTSARNEVNSLKRFPGFQSNSGNDSESTTDTTKKHLKHPNRHHKRLRKIIGKSVPVPIIVSEEIQTDDNGTDYSSDLNAIDLNTIDSDHHYSVSEIPDYEQVKSKKGNFNCRFCRKIFRSNRGRNDHENTHTGERPHQCLICQQSFARYANFWSHSKTHTD